MSAIGVGIAVRAPARPALQVVFPRQVPAERPDDSTPRVWKTLWLQAARDGELIWSSRLVVETVIDKCLSGAAVPECSTRTGAYVLLAGDRPQASGRRELRAEVRGISPIPDLGDVLAEERPAAAVSRPVRRGCAFAVCGEVQEKLATLRKGGVARSAAEGDRCSCQWFGTLLV